MSIVRCRGLPFSCTPDDLRAFFEGYAVEEVYLGTKNGKRNGEAYVEFGSAEEAARALKERQMEHLGSRYIELFVAGEADALAASSSGGGGEEGEGSGAAPAPTLSGHVVRLRGLPFNSTAQDVLSFFEGVDTLGGEEGVVFTCTPDGRPTGEAYVEVAGAEAAAAALARHKGTIGSRYIEIFESSKGDLFQAVQQHGYFTTPGGRRLHHWTQQHVVVGGGGGGYGGAEGGGRPRGQGMPASMEEMASAFAGFGLSQRDMQVPGPPRWGAYGAPADQHYQQQYSAAAARGGMAPGSGAAMRWRPTQLVPPGAAMQRGAMQHFNPAPGPPPGKGGRGGVANGGRQGGMGMSPHEYGGGHAVMYGTPFMLQHPLMMQPHAQQPGAAWGAGMMQQQVGAWYGGGMAMPGRAAMHGGGMGAHGGATAYAFSPHAGFYPVRATGMAPGGGSSYAPQQQQQQHGGGRQPAPPAPPPAAAAHVAPASSAASAPAPDAVEAPSTQQPAASGSGEQERAGSPPAADIAPAPAEAEASPPTPEQ